MFLLSALHKENFLKIIYFYLKDNCFTILCWFLPYINMNQPEVNICGFPLGPPCHLLPYPTPLGCHRPLVRVPWVIQPIPTGYPLYPGEGNGTPLQQSCLENPMDRGAWWAAVYWIAESDTTEQLHFHFSLSCTGEENGNPLRCSCLENPRDRRAWWAAISGVAQSCTWLKGLSSSSSSSPFPRNQ